MERKVVGVVGVTSRRGTAVISALLMRNEFSVRVVTAGANLGDAQRLRMLGVKDLVEAKGDVISLAAALDGCYGLYALVDRWEPLSVPYKREQIRIVVDAAMTAGVKHLVVSGIGDTVSSIPTDVASCDLCLRKKTAARIVQAREELDYSVTHQIPTTLFMPSAYYEDIPELRNWIKEPHPRRHAKKTMAVVSTEEIGDLAAGLFSRKSTKGKRLGVSVDALMLPGQAILYEDREASLPAKILCMAPKQ